MPIKVLHIINGEFYSGAERVQDLLATNLPNYGFEAHLICVKPKNFRNNCICSQSVIHDFPMSGKIDFTTTREIADFAKGIGAKIIHSHTPRSALAAALVCRHLSLPRIHHIHSPTSRDTDNTLRNISNTLAERISVTGVKKFISVSDSLSHWAVSMKIKKSKIKVIPNGVAPIHEQFVWHPQESITLGVVALFRPRKGLDILIKALHEVKKTIENIKLNVVGGFETPGYEQEIKHLAKSLGLSNHIKWVGFTKDVNSQLKQMDIFVIPSIFGEGMPMVLLEAMAAGLPVIGTNVEGIPEVARKGIEGFIVEPNDIQLLADSIVKMASDNETRKKMAQASFDRYSRHYSDKAMAEQVSEVYINVLCE